MQNKSATDALLRRLSTAVLPVEDAARAAARRDRVVARLEELVPALPVRRRERRRLRSVALLSSAAVLAATLGLVVAQQRSRARASETAVAEGAVLALEGPVQILHPAAEVAAMPRERIAIGSADEVLTGPKGRARASLASGAEVDIDPESRVRLRAPGHQARGGASSEDSAEGVTLSAGRVAVRVPKLGPARSFAVATPEATVVVHGTAFTVERTSVEGEPPRTNVDVSEGSVAVRRNGVEVVLRAGDRWSSAPTSRGAESETASGGAPASAVVAVTKHKSPPSPARGMGTSSTRNPASIAGPEKGSSLAAENQLLQTAMAARQQGDPRRAAELAAELVRRFPSSPLIEEARVERMRALAALGGAGAAEDDARSYLADYPRGFARQEASRILASVPR